MASDQLRHRSYLGQLNLRWIRHPSEESHRLDPEKKLASSIEGHYAHGLQNAHSARSQFVGPIQAISHHLL